MEIRSWLRLALVSTLLMLFGGILFTLCTSQNFTGGPRAAFELHLAALDAGEWALSDTYVKDECTIESLSGTDDAQAALQAVLDSGFSYRRTFNVDDVWLNEDGTWAILEMDTPADLPDITTMELIDGEWLIAC